MRRGESGWRSEGGGAAGTRSRNGATRATSGPPGSGPPPPSETIRPPGLDRDRRMPMQQQHASRTLRDLRRCAPLFPRGRMVPYRAVGGIGAGLPPRSWGANGSFKSGAVLRTAPFLSYSAIDSVTSRAVSERTRCFAAGAYWRILHAESVALGSELVRPGPGARRALDSPRGMSWRPAAEETCRSSVDGARASGRVRHGTRGRRRR